ncbi:MAG: hypothetical protein LUF87_07925 [Alistipes sp.]|nr:hypothetical protein [Alistipes sp.]
MKTKTGTYLLLIAALAVWGVIAWKIIRREQPGTAEALPEVPIAVKEKNPRDTLWLNYRDPFLGEILQPTVESEEPDAEGNDRVELRPVASYNVRYYGTIIKNRVENYIIEIDGQQHLFRQGSTQDGFTLRRVYPDSVLLVKDGVEFSVPMPL